VTKGKHILAVEDDAPALGALREILVQAGFEVTTSATGEQALAWLQEHVPDLVFLDVALPGLSGYEVCRGIRADPRTAGVPVVFLTARETPEDRAKGTDGDLYLVKPVLASRLLSMVSVFLGPHGEGQRAD
jgi:DNA-binding response OmpR family regulator